MTKEWAPVRPFRTWPEVEPIRYDTRQGTYVPDDSISDPAIKKVNVRKIASRGARAFLNSGGVLDDLYGWNRLTLDYIDYDTGGFYSGISGRLIFPHRGIYVVEASCQYANSAAGFRGILLRVDSTTDYGKILVPAVSGEATYLTTTAVINSGGTRVSGGGSFGPYSFVEMFVRCNDGVSVGPGAMTIHLIGAI